MKQSVRDTVNNWKLNANQPNNLYTVYAHISICRICRSGEHLAGHKEILLITKILTLPSSAWFFQSVHLNQSFVFMIITSAYTRIEHLTMWLYDIAIPDNILQHSNAVHTPISCSHYYRRKASTWPTKDNYPSFSAFFPWLTCIYQNLNSTA